MWVAELCYAQARVGDRRGAALHLSELTARATTEYISAYDLAIACVGVGENDAALDYYRVSTLDNTVIYGKHRGDIVPKLSRLT